MRFCSLQSTHVMACRNHLQAICRPWLKEVVVDGMFLQDSGLPRRLPNRDDDMYLLQSSQAEDGFKVKLHAAPLLRAPGQVAPWSTKAREVSAFTILCTKGRYQCVHERPYGDRRALPQGLACLLRPPSSDQKNSRD